MYIYMNIYILMCVFASCAVTRTQLISSSSSTDPHSSPGMRILPLQHTGGRQDSRYSSLLTPNKYVYMCERIRRKQARVYVLAKEENNQQETQRKS